MTALPPCRSRLARDQRADSLPRLLIRFSFHPVSRNIYRITPIVDTCGHNRKISYQPIYPRPHLVEIHLSHVVCPYSLDQLLEDLENVKGCPLIDLVVNKLLGISGPSVSPGHLDSQPVYKLPLGAYPCRFFHMIYSNRLKTC